MDHSWGRNVADLGLGALGATLAARFLVFTGPWYLINADRGAPTAVVVRVPLDTEPFLQYLFTTVPKGVANFPYGYPVTPDVPL